MIQAMSINRRRLRLDAQTTASKMAFDPTARQLEADETHANYAQGKTWPQAWLTDCL